MTTTQTRAAAATPDADGGFTHRQILTILSGLMLGMFLAALDQTVVSTAIRTISDDLHGFDLQAWATTAFLITSTISTPLYGKLSDQFGRRPFYLLAIGIFITGSMLCGLSQSMYELAAFRALQGAGAGGLMSLALAIIGDIVPPRQRSRYQGIFMAVFGTSSVLGPLIGGFFAGQDTILGFAGWRGIFYLNVPIGIAAFIVVARVLHLPHNSRAHRIDWPGALLLIITLVPLLTVAEQGRTWGWTSGRGLLCYAVGLVGLIGFLLAERAYGDDALLPLRLFRNRSFAVGSMSSFVVGVGMFGAIALIPLYLQVVKGSTPTHAGLQTVPLVAGIMIGGIGSGILIGRTGRYKVFPIIGTIFLVGAMLLFHLVGADTPIWQTMLIMPLFGFGLGFNFQPVILAVQNAVDPREMGVATSSVTFFRQMGGTAGTAAFLSILFTTVGGKIGSAFSTAQGTPAFQQAAAAHPDQARTLSGGAGSVDLQDTSFLNRIDATLAHPFKVGFSQSVDLIFLIAAAVLILGLIVVAFLPEVELRTTSGVQARTQSERPEALTEASVASSVAVESNHAGSKGSADHPVTNSVNGSNGGNGLNGVNGSNGSNGSNSVNGVNGDSRAGAHRAPVNPLTTPSDGHRRGAHEASASEHA